jgi:hypothetical protein
MRKIQKVKLGNKDKEPLEEQTDEVDQGSPDSLRDLIYLKVMSEGA